MINVNTADNFVKSFGFSAYRVGGSVRDEIIGRPIKDADYVITGADLEEVRKAISKKTSHYSALTLRNGIHVGWRVLANDGTSIEICLPRQEISTGVGHGDFEIDVDGSIDIVHDASRRDFTMNAIYRKLDDGQMFDLFAGISDIKSKKIVVMSKRSFDEDPLRILRAARFASQLEGFEVDSLTQSFMKENSHSVTGLTKKGVSGTAYDELIKMLMAPYPTKGLRLLRDTGVLSVFIPELEEMIGFDQESSYHDLTVDEHTFLALEYAAEHDYSLRVRLALLFHDAGKPATAWRGEDGRLHYYARKDDDWGLNHETMSSQFAYEALTRFNAPMNLITDTVTLVNAHMIDERVKPAKIRRYRARLGDDLFADLIKHKRADAHGKLALPDEKVFNRLDKMEQVRVESKHVPVSVVDLNIDGNELMKIGFQGPAIGETLRTLLKEVLSKPERNTNEWLKQRAKKEWKEYA